jgi:hypothetical protein
MSTRKVFIFWTHPLFHDAVRAMLHHPQVQWVGSSSDYFTVSKQIETCGADTIVVEEVEGKGSPQILSHLEENYSIARIMGINLQDNQARMVHRNQRTVRKAEDLLNWLLND